MYKRQGYKNLDDVIKNGEALKAGDKVYANNMDKAIALFIVGERPMEDLSLIHIFSIRYKASKIGCLNVTDILLLSTTKTFPS